MNTKVLGRRVAAVILDALIIGALVWGLFFLLADDPVVALQNGDVTGNTTIYGNLELGDKTYSVYGGTALLWFVFSLLISVGNWVFLQGTRGFTIGKAIVGCAWSRTTAPHLPAWAAPSAAGFIYIADGFPYFIPYLTGFIVALVRSDNKRSATWSPRPW